MDDFKFITRFYTLYCKCEYVSAAHNISNAKIVGYRFNYVSSHFEIYEGGSYKFAFLINDDFVILEYPKDTGFIIKSILKLKKVR